MPCLPYPRIIALLCALLSGAAQAQNPAPTPVPVPVPAAAEPAPVQPTPAAVAGDRNAALSDRIPSEQVLWLQAGADRFLARYQPDLTGQPRGTAIVLHDSGRHPSWPATVAALIDELPLHGWGVMAIELPAPALDRSAALAAATPPATAPPATSPPATAEPAPPPATASPTAPAAPGAPAIPAAEPEPALAGPELIERQSQARIAAALNHLIEQKQTQVAVIGFGSGALRAAEFVRRRAADNGAGATAPIAALALIEPLDHLPGLTETLPQLLPATVLPALDLALRNDRRARAEAEARRRAVLHQRGRDYQQVELPPVIPALSATHSAVVKRVRGWLQRHVVANAGEGKPTQPGPKLPAPAGAAADPATANSRATP
jgi:hypothetical protein